MRVLERWKVERGERVHVVGAYDMGAFVACRHVVGTCRVGAFVVFEFCLHQRTGPRFFRVCTEVRSEKLEQKNDCDAKEARNGALFW